MNFDNIRELFDRMTASGEIAGIAAAITTPEKTIFESTCGVTSIGGTANSSANRALEGFERGIYAALRNAVV